MLCCVKYVCRPCVFKLPLDGGGACLKRHFRSNGIRLELCTHIRKYEYVYSYIFIYNPILRNRYTHI